MDLTLQDALGAAGREAKGAFRNSLGGKGLSAGLAGKLAELHQQGRKSYTDLLSRQLKIERQLAVLVEDAYGLTPEERAWMRATRPVRDPLDVLGAKIAGK